MLTQAQKAQDEFQLEMRRLGIEQLKIKDDEGNVVTGVNLQAMALPEMWLPKLMMRTDDLSNAIFGERVFDVGYKYNPKTLTGISISEITEEEANEYGYNHKVVSDDNLRSLMIKHATATSIRNEAGFAFIKEFETFHMSNEDDLFIRPMKGELLIAALLRDFTEKAYPVMKNILKIENKLEPSI